MKLLLDTHTLIWFLEGNKRLSSWAREAIESNENECWVSLASLWEMSIKAARGRLEVRRPIPRLIQEHLEGNDIQLLHVNGEHLEALIKLPYHHKDPFDRLIIAQAAVESLTLVSCDGQFKAYPVELLW